jgi:hypothetical protein
VLSNGVRRGEAKRCCRAEFAEVTLVSNIDYTKRLELVEFRLDYLFDFMKSAFCDNNNWIGDF